MPRSVLVTGGNRGLGLTTAQMFADAGDSVAITHRGSSVPEGMLGVKCDVTDDAQVANAFEEAKAAHGPVEVLVCNAGIKDDALLPRMSEEQFHRVVDTNLGGAYRMAKVGSRGMLRMRRGRIILISSVTGVRGVPGQTNYAASKAGLIGFARALAWEVGPRGITVNVITPGVLDTDMVNDVPQEQRNKLADVPLGREARLEEVAATSVWLASELAGSITGAVIPVDGGAGMGH